MHKTLTSVVALAGLAAASGAQAEPITLTEEQSDAVVAGDIGEPMLLTSTQMDTVTAGSVAIAIASAEGDVTVFFSGFLFVSPSSGSANIRANIDPGDGFSEVFVSAFASTF